MFVRLYANMIKSGKWTIERVPEKFRNDVEELLEKEKNAINTFKELLKKKNG